ncbi:BTB domain-containing protein [Caenorhabditis elegans]|uniref:BTB domain-containing protein n=1 Tax=Caenorhabditis elegans TaxID=6239 RepID=Q9TZM5_CAEEL|nr:BTB domain-containing protein [Caenorhabditis elegans]CCD71545.2 BTB domain-containing protein [Caenorhabditis elegans]|eukprot:NP_001317756.1 BTB and MATH domain containing [Caenorhabditis elegans]
MTNSTRKFSLKQKFTNVSCMVNHEKRYGPSQVHFDIPWRMKIQRSGSDLAAFLCCQKSENAENLMVHFEMKLISILGTEKSRKTKFKICDLKPGNDGYGWDFMNWEDMENQFLIDDSIRMECHVELKYIERTSYRKFDESAKEFSDVILVAEKQKFYVSKLFLSFQSSYFHALLLGNFIESTSSEIELKDVNSTYFQYFLELLHGESSITAENVEHILHLADMFDARTAIRRCEEFLNSLCPNVKLKDKLRLAVQYRLGTLKEKSLEEVKTIADIPDILPVPIRELNLRSAISLLRRS